MTTRTRTPRRTSGTRRRTGRLVWVNKNIQQLLTDNGVSRIDLLDAAKDFMVFDTTIVSVLISELWYNISVEAAVVFNRRVRCVMQTAIKTIDTADFEPLFGDSIGPPYMWTGGNGELKSGGGFEPRMDIIPQGEPVFVKAKRRFKENDASLFLVAETKIASGDASVELNGYIRTLIYIP